MTMSDATILRTMSDGRIKIHPFRRENLSTSSYDVSLGEWFYREQKPRFSGNIYNIYNPQHVEKVWGEPCQAETASEVFRDVEGYHGFGPDDRIVVLEPGETILAHTEEFIGGRVDVTTMMKARSSLGRSFIMVCKCLHPDTPVRMADGTEKRIDEIRRGDHVVNADRNGHARVARVRSVRRSTEPKRVFEIRTKGGRTTRMSEDHLCRVSGSHGPAILPVRELTTDHALPVLRKAPPPSHVSDMSDEEAAMLGYFVAEGNWQKYRVSVAKDVTKKDQRKEIMRLFKGVLNAPDPTPCRQQLAYNSVNFAAEFLKRYPECCELAQDKRLPPRLMNAPLSAIREFLRTYISCDGSIRKERSTPSVGYKSRSEGLIRDVTYLAARLGCAPAYFNTRLGSTGNPCRGANFYGNDAHELGHPNFVKVDRSWSVLIPDLMKIVKDRYNLSRSQLNGYATSDAKSISRAKLLEISRDNDEPVELEPYINDLVWDPISEIVRSRVAQTGLVDISLDVTSEQDALFALGDGLMTLNCAGWGDVGYVNRWTMEVTNASLHYHIPLLVGQPVAQIVFMDTGPILDKDYGQTGNYQTTQDFEELRRNWSPISMLPRLKRRTWSGS